MVKNDKISEVTSEILEVLNGSKLNASEKKKAIWRAESQIAKPDAKPKAKIGKSSKKAKKKKKR